MSFILTTNYDVEKYYPHICKQKSQSTEKLNCPDHATRKWQNRGFHRGSLGQSNCRARPPSHYITVSLILQASWKCTTYTESQIWRLSFGSSNCSRDFSGCKEKQPTRAIQTSRGYCTGRHIKTKQAGAHGTGHRHWEASGSTAAHLSASFLLWGHKIPLLCSPLF